ncbi:protein of unknown function [Catalinimonas alkaloidigena]|uniref:YfiR family protein n=1 Tax=Catalinimonas alkaloidigena TaxID=1075417 RepID=A0A1G9HXJ3_9BACT|nr:protein of unknown function [Catalinimonas alkaloidigena]
MVALLWLLRSGMGWAQGSDYRAQSLFIYNFSKYITWPDSAQTGDFVIGIYGNSPILRELEVMAALKKAGNGRDIVVRPVDRLEQLQDLHLLYLTAAKSRELRDVLTTVGTHPILILAERGGMAQKGADLNFIVMENATLKFEVNTQALKNHHLEIAPELLRIGFVVN